MSQLYIKMFGDFSLQCGENRISNNDNRSKKMWILLAYLLCRKDRIVSRKELIRLLWGDDAAINNPENTLKTTFHRLRTLLNQLWPNAGHELITFQEGGYKWNTDIPLTIDMEQFDRLFANETTDKGERLQNLLDALALYNGDFLSNFSSESWVIPVAAHYHNLYIQTILEIIPLLIAHKRHKDISDICRKALVVEPYHESLHLHLMQALTELNDSKGAVTVYESLAQHLFDDFGIKPGKALRDYYRSITNPLSDQALPMDVVLEHLQEMDASPGALQCEYDYFKILCHAEARAMIRSGNATHIALISVTGRLDEKPLSKRSLETTMKYLGEEIRLNLRRGDAFSRCSVSQYIVMLPRANYENSCMVCRRVLGAFWKKHSHSTAKIQFVVQPLSPDSLEHR